MFRRKKKIFEYDPKDLNLELLSTLQVSLIAKLILVNDELKLRYQNISGLSSELPDVADSRQLLSESAARLSQINEVLRDELERATRQPSPN